jgi:hypothetical protein
MKSFFLILALFASASATTFVSNKALQVRGGAKLGPLDSDMALKLSKTAATAYVAGSGSKYINSQTGGTDSQVSQKQRMTGGAEVYRKGFGRDIGGFSFSLSDVFACITARYLCDWRLVPAPGSHHGRGLRHVQIGRHRFRFHERVGRGLLGRLGFAPPVRRYLRRHPQEQRHSGRHCGPPQCHCLRRVNATRSVCVSMGKISRYHGLETVASYLPSSLRCVANEKSARN